MNTPGTTAMRIARTDQTFLAALLASVPRSRLFARTVCSAWQLEQERVAVAELLITELAANAVHAGGVTGTLPATGQLRIPRKLIGVRLLELEDSLVIEVWDTSSEPPRLMETDDTAEHGHGLQLVDALSTRWGHYSAPMGGKVVWCQVGGDADESQDPAAVRCVAGALQRQAWNEQA